jgi:hypothetical protein
VDKFWRVARNPSGNDAKRGNHVIQAELPITIRGNLVSMTSMAIRPESSHFAMMQSVSLVFERIEAALRGATRFLGCGQRRQRGDVWVAVRSVDRGGRRLELEPLQQRDILGMVREPVHGYWENRVLKTLDYVADFHAVLAIPVRRQPPRRNVMDAVTCHEWIIKDFRHFVAGAGHIQKSGTEKPRSDPTRIVQHITPLGQARAG